MQAIAAAYEQLIQPPESWLYAFPLHLTIDAYQGGAGTSINMNSNEVLANLVLDIYFILKVNTRLFNQMTLSINLNRPMMSIQRRCVLVTY